METRAVVKKMILDWFKGAKHVEVDFFMKTLCAGRNGSGKTTLFDAYTWALADKDSRLKPNPEVHSEAAEESEPSVTILFDVNGKDLRIRKYQKDNRTKSQKESGMPVRITNQYEINDVPVSKKEDFIARLAGYGIVIDTLLLLSHPDIFTELKSVDCRKTLFGMVSEITDKKIADSMDACEDLGVLLENYSIDEVAAMKKREQKEAEQSLDAIPEQIIGMEKSKVDADADMLKRQKSDLSEEIACLETQVDSLNIPSVGELNQKLVLLEKEERNLVAEANSERVANLTGLNATIGDLNLKMRHMQSDREQFVSEIEHSMQRQKDLEQEYNDLAASFQEWKAKEFDASAQICQYCGQSLPVQDIDKAHKTFEQTKRTEMDSINRRAAEIKNKIHPEIKKEISENETAIKNIDTRIKDVSAQIEKLMEERAKYETVITVTGTPEHQEILRQIAETHHAMNQRDALVGKADEINIKIRDRQQAIRVIDDKLAQLQVNEQIDKRIAELRNKQVEYRQAIANASKILNQIKAVSMEKNRRLTDEVNSHFEIVKFQLFETLKNGDVRDCCIPTIRNDDGVYRVFGASANTALEVRGKLDIISGLQKFYGQHLPVFLDGAECLDSKSLERIHMDTQLILLSVSDGDLAVVEG